MNTPISSVSGIQPMSLISIHAAAIDRATTVQSLAVGLPYWITHSMTCIFNGKRVIHSYVAMANCRVHNSLLLYITIYAYVANTVADEINMV